MTHVQVQLPFKGFTEQSPYSVVPPGMTPSCLNVMPADVWNGRMRLSVRNGSQRYNLGDVQFMSTYRVYESGVLVEKLIFVRAGIVYYANPHGAMPVTPTAFGNQASAKLVTDKLVEGVQFNEYFYFVDGTNYVFVDLVNPSSATAVQIWGGASPQHGPYHTDPSSVQPGERATLICRWGPRLVLAGYKRTPNVWFACAPDAPYPHSGSGGPTDGWTGNDYVGSASGGTSTDWGTLGDPIVAIFPFAQSGLMFGCTNSFTFLTNDPVFEESVSMVSLTRSIGIAGRRAFCQSQEKGAFILANDGLYFLNANDFNFNRGNRVSAGRLDSFFLRLDFGTPAIGGSGPLAGGTLRSLIGSDGTGSGAKIKTLTTTGTVTESPTLDEISIAPSVESLIGSLATGQVFPVLCYDPDREGVWVFLSVSGVEQSSVHLYYDLKTDSFWPQRFSDPEMYAPSSACYVGTSRTTTGKLFMGGSDSISVIDRGSPRGIDGYYDGIGEDPELQRTQFVRSSLTMGPILAPLPYRIQINEIRVDMAEDIYEVPDDWTDASEPPVLSISTGETAQAALGLQVDKIFVSDLNPLVIDCGGATVASPSPTYDGGDYNDIPTNTIDGRFATRPFGEYSQSDPFSNGTARVFNGPGDWVIRFNGTRWILEDFVTTVDEYRQITPDQGSPNGLMENLIQTPISPDEKDTVRVSNASFSSAEVTEIAELAPGRNDAKKCRIRAEAAYVTVASDGKPWSIERMSMIVGQVGKSRGD
jgi:hypothetical protein